MSRIKATIRSLYSWQHPEEIACEVEEELQFHIAKRTVDNIERGMTPYEAQLAARVSFGNFYQIKTECCEISRDVPFNAGVLRMGMYIALAVLAGATALWVVNVPHHNLTALLWQVIAIAILARAFIAGRRNKGPQSH